MQQSGAVWTQIFFLIRLYRQSFGLNRFCEPIAADLPEICGEGEFGVAADSRVEPGGRIAEAFAAILAPAPMAESDFWLAERGFPPFRRPAQFPGGSPT